MIWSTTASTSATPWPRRWAARECEARPAKPGLAPVTVSANPSRRSDANHVAAAPGGAPEPVREAAHVRERLVTPAGYRDYAPDVLARIDFIHRGQAAGLTLAQIGQILAIREDGQAPCEHVRDLLDTRLRDLDPQISQLVALRDTITQLRVQADNAEPATCGADRVCRYL
jgi:MerR family transcriptional regulator, Zn(II)-responsive regulator of zntA